MPTAAFSMHLRLSPPLCFAARYGRPEGHDRAPSQAPHADRESHEGHEGHACHGWPTRLWLRRRVGKSWRWCNAAYGLCALLLASSALAHAVTQAECSEGSEFIMHAALSRDHGLSRAAYIAQLQSDLITIRAFPAPLRWFVQDDDDEFLLVSAVTEVFDHPQSPDAHRQAFLQRCLGVPASPS